MTSGRRTIKNSISRILPVDQQESSAPMERNIHGKYLIFRLLQDCETGSNTGSNTGSETGSRSTGSESCTMFPLVIPYSCGITISANNFAFS